MSDWTPLAGVKVIDLSQQLPGPFATLLLRTLGASVVKVEPPSGDHSLIIDPPLFERMNSDKEIVTIDLKSDAGREQLHAMVAEADVFFEGMRPGVVKRLAADWETLSAINPGLVYCSLSGFGPTGPLVERAGHDLNFLALAAGLPDGLPDSEGLIRVPWVDLASGTNCALAVLAALIDRATTGKGRHLEIALMDAAAIWSSAKLPREGSEGAYGVFETADRRRVVIAVLEDAMWTRMFAALGWSDWAEDQKMADHDYRRMRGDEVRTRVTESIAALTLAEVLELADQHDLAVTRVNDIDEAAVDPQIASRDLFPDDEHWRPLGPMGQSLRRAPRRES